MKKLIFIFLFLITTSVISQDYFPLKTGNKFVYYYYYSGHMGGPSGGSYFGSYKTKIEINRDTIFYGKKYYFYIGFPNIGDCWLRVDSITGSLYSYDSAGSCQFYFHDRILDSLKLDSINAVENSCSNWKLTTKGIDTLYNHPSYYKYFKSPSNITWENRKYDRLFGLISYDGGFNAGSSWGNHNGNLIGCFINGILYGDTTVTSIVKLGNTLPSSFSLSQNYPNPFNPTTNIKYQITQNKLVALKIFDIIGKEIATLVNEKQSPGTYEVTWDASAFPSGVYFYKLTSGDFAETKKMILIK